ncbi:MAG: hypothetical protein ACJ8CR_17600 [Roseiflexaceae bacterium]
MRPAPVWLGGQPLRDDPVLFAAARVEDGTITWPNGVNIDPDVLYLGLPPNATEAEWHAAQAHHMTVKDRKP